jgi:hypothetical protein
LAPSVFRFRRNETPFASEGPPAVGKLSRLERRRRFLLEERPQMMMQPEKKEDILDKIF